MPRLVRSRHSPGGSTCGTDSTRWFPTGRSSRAPTAGSGFGHDGWEVTGFALASRVAGSASLIRRLRDEPLHGYARADRAGGPDTLAGRTSLDGFAGQLRVNRVTAGCSGARPRASSAPGSSRTISAFSVPPTGCSSPPTGNTWCSIPGIGSAAGRSVPPSSAPHGHSAGSGGRRCANLTGRVDLSSYWGGKVAWDHEFGASRSGDPARGPSAPSPRARSGDGSGLLRYAEAVAADGGQWERRAGAGGVGSAAWSLGPSYTAFVSDRLQLGLAPAVERRVEGWQYAGQAERLERCGSLRAGRLRQTTASLTTRATYAFSSHLTLQLYGQIFLSDGLFDRFKEVVNASAADAGARVSSMCRWAARRRTVSADPSFSDRDFHLNLLMRWEFRRALRCTSSGRTGGSTGWRSRSRWGGISSGSGRRRGRVRSRRR